MTIRDTPASGGDACRVFFALVAGDQALLPIGEIFLSRPLRMFSNRLGTPWMVTVEDQEARSDLFTTTLLGGLGSPLGSHPHSASFEELERRR